MQHSHQKRPQLYDFSNIILPLLRKHNAIMQFFQENYGIHNAFVFVFLYINLGVNCSLWMGFL